MGGTLPRLLKQPRVRADWEAALADACELVRPAALWDAFPISEWRHERLVLANGLKIGGGPVAAVVAGAAELVVALCTIGGALTQRITHYQQAGQNLRAMFLNDWGSWAVDQVRQQFCRRMEAEARTRGWRATAALSPGESEWSVTDQAVVFQLLDGGAIGVSLTPTLMMSPLKSLSLILGIGAGPLGVEGASNCDFCTIRERCRYRRLRPPAPAAG